MRALIFASAASLLLRSAASSDSKRARRDITWQVNIQAGYWAKHSVSQVFNGADLSCNRQHQHEHVVLPAMLAAQYGLDSVVKHATWYAMYVWWAAMVRC